MKGRLGTKPPKRALLLATKPCLETLIKEGNRVFAEDKYPKINGERLMAQNSWRAEHESKAQKILKQQSEAEARKRLRQILGRAL